MAEIIKNDKDTTVLECRICGNLGYYMDIRDDRGADQPDYKFGTCGECDPPQETEIIFIKNDKGDHDECCACGKCPVEDYICDCSVCGRRLYDEDEIACDGDTGGCCPGCAPEDHRRCNCHGYYDEC